MRLSLAVATTLLATHALAEPLAPRLLSRIDLASFAPDGAYARGQLQFGDLDGDGRSSDFVRSQNGRRFQAFRWDGAGAPTLLWSFENPLAETLPLPPDRYHYKLVVHDLDGDGKAEVIAPVPMPTGKIALQIRDGATGAVKAEVSTAIDNPKTDHPVNETRIRLTVADLSGKGRASDVVLLTENDSTGDIFAFDAALKPLWDTTADNGAKRRIYAHYPWHADLDGDGRQETIAATTFGGDGKPLFRMTPGFWAPADLFYDHLDRVIVGDLDPARPGLEVVMSYEFNKARLTDAEGREIWSKPNLAGDSKLAAVGEFRTASAGAEFLVYDPANKGKLIMLDIAGKEIGEVKTPGGRFDGYVIDWDGDPTTDEAFQSQGGALLAPASGYGVEIAKLYLKDAATPTQPVNRTFGAALDLTGDRREEIVLWDDNELLVYGASGPAPSAGESWWSKPAYRLAVANAMNDNHPERPHLDFRMLLKGEQVAARRGFAPASGDDLKDAEMPEANAEAGLGAAERRAVTLRRGGGRVVRIGRPGEAAGSRAGQLFLSPPARARKFYTFATGDMAIMDFEPREGGRDAVVAHLTALLAAQGFKAEGDGLAFVGDLGRVALAVLEEEKNSFRVTIDLKGFGG
jgi:outer membrane protein assembly factor BamB